SETAEPGKKSVDPVSTAVTPTLPPKPAESGADAPELPRDAGKALRVEEAVRLPGAALHSTGLAYDGGSGRFIVADRGGRKIVIIDERSQHLVDLVRSGSAGFFEITGLEIDPRRGDLWVASRDPAAEPGGSPATALTAALHKLQLVSGRPLEAF